jgi:hypothetical protein
MLSVEVRNTHVSQQQVTSLVPPSPSHIENAVDSTFLFAVDHYNIGLLQYPPHSTNPNLNLLLVQPKNFVEKRGCRQGRKIKTGKSLRIHLFIACL